MVTAQPVWHLMRTLRWPTFEVKRAARRPCLRATPYPIRLARNRHHVGIDKALVAAIGQRQPSKHIDLAFAIGATLLHLRDIIRLSVEASGHIGQRQFGSGRPVALRDDR